MSNEALTAVFERSQSRGNARLVLLAIADRADAGGRTWCGAADLVSRTKANRDTVFAALRSLRDSGELLVEDEHGPKGCNVYQISASIMADRSETPTSPKIPTSRKKRVDQYENSDGGSRNSPTHTLQYPRNPSRAAKTNPPTLAELREFVGSIGLPPDDGEHLFHHWQENGFTRQSGSKQLPILDWKATARKWKSGKWFPSQKRGSSVARARTGTVLTTYKGGARL